MADAFSSAVKKSVNRELDTTALLAVVEALHASGEPTLVLELYRIWLRANSDHPMAYAIWFNYGTALSNSIRLSEAQEALSESVKANAAFAPGYINLASVFEKLGQADRAVQNWSRAVECVPGITAESISHKKTALKQIGRVLETAREEAAAENILRQAIELDPNQRDVIQHWIALRQVQCTWPSLAPVGTLTVRDLLGSISPLSIAAATDDPIAQLTTSYNYNKHDVGLLQTEVANRQHVKDGGLQKRLRIGYVSSDLREHAVGFLMSEVFELHDPLAVEVFAYYCGITTNDTTHQRFKASAHHWRDISSMPDEEAAALIVADGIDILVDLNGYTKDARLKLFAMRPAPIIVNWLGFPGTMGSTYHHYIIADPVIIPPESEHYYSEKVLRLPCYQPNDRKRAVAEKPITRLEAGLPEHGFVYCCFNGTQKITPFVFDHWMKILSKAPGAVLWLLSGTSQTNDVLKARAEAAGISRDRVVFAGRMHNPDHLARYQLADVFLDTAPYGAHTTASDALWMGVPVLTVPGNSFASRVCASLVSAAGLGELVCSTFDEYVETALALYADRPALQRLKAHLGLSQRNSKLFDTPDLVKKLEGLYRSVWCEYLAGRLHRPDLSNLEILREVACDLNAVNLGDKYGQDRSEEYRRKLLDRGAYSTFMNDIRIAAKHDASAIVKATEGAASPVLH